jgi:hypothetical protein
MKRRNLSTKDTKIPSLTREQEQMLRNQVIDDTHPGALLRDFAVLLDFLGSEKIEVSAKTSLLSMKALGSLNARLSHPVQLAVKRPQQKSYPYIHGLYLLLRTTGLATVERTGTKQFLVLDEAILRSWQGLNPTEHYCTLLEAWVIRSSPEILGERRGGIFNTSLHEWLSFFQRIPEQGLQIAGMKDRTYTMLSYYPGLHNLALFDLFGLITLQQRTTAAEQGWGIKSIQRTALGNALLLLLYRFYDTVGYQWAYEENLEAPFGELQPALQPFFPEWRNNLTLPQHEFHAGVHVFKVSLGKVWRRIAIPGKMNLDRLSDTILDAFDFDYDHLYEFTYRSRTGAPVHVNHPYIEEPPFTSDVRIGDLPLQPGTTMTYLYDFGDNWEFAVTLEQRNPVDPKMRRPVILEEHGKAPEQYPGWEDEEWEEEDWEDEEEE